MFNPKTKTNDINSPCNRQITQTIIHNVTIAKLRWSDINWIEIKLRRCGFSCLLLWKDPNFRCVNEVFMYKLFFFQIIDCRLFQCWQSRGCRCKKWGERRSSQLCFLCSDHIWYVCPFIVFLWIQACSNNYLYKEEAIEFVGRAINKGPFS